MTTSPNYTRVGWNDNDATKPASAARFTEVEDGIVAVDNAAVAALALKADLSAGVVPAAQLPALAINDVFPVASQAAMLALTAQRGDMAIRTDLSPSAVFVLTADAPATLGNWVQLSVPSASVTSVAGRQGVVTLAKADVGLTSVDNTADTAKPVSTAQAAANAINAAAINAIAGRSANAWLTNPPGLRGMQAHRVALRSRVDYVCIGNSVVAGQGASGVAGTYHPAGPSYAWALSDNYNGWVGQLRTLLNAPLGLDPGEGFVFPTDPRVTLAGTAAPYQFIGPNRTGAKVPSGQTATMTTFSAGAGVPKLAYVGIIVWDQATNSLPTVTVAGSGVTLKTTPGGSTNLATTGTSAIVVGYAPCTQGQTVVVTGGTSDTYLAGFDLVGDVNGYHVHDQGIPGFVTGDLLAGQLSGVLVGTTGAGNQIDRVVRSSYQWCPGPGMIIVGHLDINDSGFQNVTKVVNVTSTGGTSLTVNSGSVDSTDAQKAISGTGVTGGTTLQNVNSLGTTLTASANVTAGTFNLTITGTGAVSGITPTLSATWLSQFLNNTGGTSNSGALTNGWCALIIGGPRLVNDLQLPLPPFTQSAYIAAQAGIINTADANYQHIAAVDLSKIWGSQANASTTRTPLQNSASVHPTVNGYASIAGIIAEVVTDAASLGALTTSVPA